MDEIAAGSTLETSNASARAAVDGGGEEEARVLRRLERIDALDRTRAPGALLGELRQLVREAEALARVGTGERVSGGVEEVREEAEGMH